MTESDFLIGFVVGSLIILTYCIIIDYFTDWKHKRKLWKDDRLETKKGMYTFEANREDRKGFLRRGV